MESNPTNQIGDKQEGEFLDIVDGKYNKLEHFVDTHSCSGEALDGDEEEFVFASSNQNDNDDKFDLYVGALQDILMDEEFEKMRKQFSTKHCMEFEATEENKLSYMQIFKEYQDTIESYLLKRLSESIDDFSMEYFTGELKQRKDEIDDMIMDLLLSFSDFEQFKEMMVFERAHFVATTPKPVSKKAAALGLKNSVAEMNNSSNPPEIKLENNKANENELKYFENVID